MTLTPPNVLTLNIHNLKSSETLRYRARFSVGNQYRDYSEWVRRTWLPLVHKPEAIGCAPLCGTLRVIEPLALVIKTYFVPFSITFPNTKLTDYSGDMLGCSNGGLAIAGPWLCHRESEACGAFRVLKSDDGHVGGGIIRSLI
jgi:hypothetical protein